MTAILVVVNYLWVYQIFHPIHIQPIMVQVDQLQNKIFNKMMK